MTRTEHLSQPISDCALYYFFDSSHSVIACSDGLTTSEYNKRVIDELVDLAVKKEHLPKQVTLENRTNRFVYTLDNFFLKEKDIVFFIFKLTECERLLDIENKLDSLMLNIPANIYWQDKNGVLTDCSLYQAITLGYKSRQEVVGKHLTDLIPNDEAAFLQKTIDEVMASDCTIRKEEKLTYQGKPHYLLSQKIPHKDKLGIFNGILGVSIDITKEKLADIAKSEFIANMSHDIRTPLTGIIGMSQDLFNIADDARSALEQSLASNSPASPEEQLSLFKGLVNTVLEDSQLLLGATDQLLELCNEIIETMRLDSGHAPEEPESFNLRDVIKHNIELLSPVASHKKLTLTYELDDSIPLYFVGLRNYLDRTLLNLLSNALKFTSSGFVKVRVIPADGSKVSQSPGSTIQLQLRVEDSGMGIPEDKFEIIFEHFSRLTPAYQGIYKGAGLGLYTVKRYVEAMKGTINLTSEVGKGTQFILTLPLVISDYCNREKIPEPELKPLEVQRIPSLPVSTPEKQIQTHSVASVLVVEDNPLAAKSLQAALSRFRCASHHAETGIDAITMVQENDYDLILMDIGLGDGIDGVETTRQIRALTMPDVPIIAVTGHANDPEQRKACLAAGMQDVCSKPMQQSRLETLLQQHVFARRKPELIAKDAPAQSSKDVSSVIDWQASLALWNGDEKVLRDLLSVLDVDLKMSLATLENAYMSQDVEALRNELHRVRGGVCYLVLPALSNALARFHEEIKKKPQNAPLVADFFENVKVAIADFVEALKSMPFAA